jgi:hypothetical protein
MHIPFIRNVLAGTVLLTLAPGHVSGWNLTQLTSFYPTSFELLDVEISGDHAYVPGGLGGLSIIDVSNPSSLKSVGSFIASGCEYGRIYAWHVDGNTMYGSGRDCGFKIVDISDKGSPELIADYGAAGRSYEHSDGFGEYLFAAAHTDGVEIIDISDPSFALSAALVPTDNAWAVEVSADGHYLYVADGAGGLKIIDINEPTLSQLIGDAPTSGTAKDVASTGQFIFVAVGAAGVDMIDVSDPFDPILVANYNTTGYASRVAVSDSLVVVSDWDDVEVLAWNDLPSLTLAGYKNTGGRVMAVNMIGDLIYSAEWVGLHTFQFGPIYAPDLDVSPKSLDFPHTAIDSCRESVVSVMNNGTEPLQLESASVNNGDYQVTIPTGGIPPGTAVEGTITYCATSESGQGRLTLQSNDPDESVVTVDLDGNSTWGLEVGESAPNFTLSAVNEYPAVNLSQLHGQVVVVAFFASW